MQLRAAIAVQDEGTVTGAARSLGLTQPSVSRLVALLEAELGFAVFDRRSKRLLPSERGRRWLEEARTALAGLTRLAVTSRELGRGRRGLLRLGAIPALAHGLLVHAASRHVRLAPDMVLEIRQMPRQEQLIGLREGWLDAGLAALPLSAVGLRIEPVGEAPAQCFLPAGHRLAALGALTPVDLAQEVLVLGRDEFLLRQRVDDAFRQARIRPNPLLVTDSTPLALALVAAGGGVAISHATPGWAVPAGVTACDFVPRLASSYALITRAAETRPAAIQLLYEVLRAAAVEAWQPARADPLNAGS